MAVDLDNYDRQLELIAVLNGDEEFMALFPKGCLEDDPTNVSPEEIRRCAAVLAGDGDENRTGATYIEIAYISIMIYVYDKDKAKAKKRDIVQATGKVREIVRKYPTRNNTEGQQAWYQIAFRQPATTYHTGANFRQSITYLELYARRRSPGAVLNNNPYG